MDNKLCKDSRNPHCPDSGIAITGCERLVIVPDEKSDGEYIVGSGLHRDERIRKDREVISRYLGLNFVPGDVPPGVKPSTLSEVTVRRADSSIVFTNTVASMISGIEALIDNALRHGHTVEISPSTPWQANPIEIMTGLHLQCPTEPTENYDIPGYTLSQEQAVALAQTILASEIALNKKDSNND